MSTPIRILVLTAIAIGTVVSLTRQPLTARAAAAALPSANTGGGQFNPGRQSLVAEGEKVEVPDSDGCFIHITAWENGSWVDPASPPGRRWPQQGKATDTNDAKNDVAEIKRWLEHLLAQSADMRKKTKAACEASGRKFIQIALVRDDPKAGPGTAFHWTPLVLIDVGDTEKLAKSAKTNGARNPSLENSARMTLSSYLPLTIIVHEIDHMKRKNKQFHHDAEEELAMGDENTVAAELEHFRPHTTEGGGRVPKLERKSYNPVVYTYRPFRDMSIEVTLDSPGAGYVFEQRERGQAPRFTDLSDDDDHALGGVPLSQPVEGSDADLDGVGTVLDNCPDAWNPRQQDRNGDGLGDDCDPGIVQDRRFTQSQIESVVDAVAAAAAQAGGAPQLALIGPGIPGGLRFVRLAEVWPIADPFGIFRSPGIGDRYLDSWLRTAVSVRLAALRLFLEPFGVPPTAIVGTGLQDSYRFTATESGVQAFAARLRTFSAGSAFGAAIIIPVWVDPPRQAGWRRLPSATAAGQPLMLAAVHPGLGGPGGGSPAAVALRESGALGSRAPGRRLLPRAEHGVDRHSSAHAARGADQRAAAPGAQGAQRQTNEPPRPSVKLFFVSTGQTTGTAFKMTAVNDGNVPVWLMLDTFALKPLANVTAADVERQMKPFAGRGRVTMDVDGYCLDFPKQPPPAGMVFGLADDTLQAAMDPIDRIAHAVVRIRALGRLQPDTEDATEYAHDMVQWSIWTLREGFDEPRFTRAFVEHVRKNFVAAGDRWTRDLERTVAALAPARWRVIQTILRESAVLPRP